MKYTILKGNTYIQNNFQKINSQYRLKYHFEPLIGWINDPNGLIYYNDEFHLFFQYYPYDSKWGPMHFGHATSKDLLTFTDLGIALAPDRYDETGCFSGGAINVGKDLVITYTRHFDNGKEYFESIALAKSIDGINYQKTEVVFDNNSLPSYISRNDFRDPYPIYINGMYYVLVGAKNTIQNKGMIVILKGISLDKLEYHFAIELIDEFGEMCECPSFFRSNENDCLIWSSIKVKQKGNDYIKTHSSIGAICHINFEEKKYSFIHIQELDKGDAFYAPEFINCYHKPVMIGWMDTWNKEYYTDKLNQGYAGAFNLPRLLEIKDNCFFQKPFFLKNDWKEIKEIKKNCLLKICGNKFLIRIVGDNGNVSFGNDDGVFLNTNEANNLNPNFWRSNEKYEMVNLLVFLDTTSIEIFINDGKEVISSRIFIDGAYSILKEGSVDFKIYEIGA